MRGTFTAARAAVIAVFIAACGSSGGGGGGDDVAEGLVAIEIQPADMTIAWTGAPAAVEYKAIGYYDDGHTAEIEAQFALDDAGSALGAIGGHTFTASGARAGKGGVQASRGDISGQTSVIVSIHTTTVGPGVPSNGVDNFPDTAPAGALSPTVVYPLDGAVMPSSVKAPNVQWEMAAPLGGGDLYRVRWTAGLATVDAIVADAPGFANAVQPSLDDWARLLASANGAALQVHVDHWDAANGPAGGATASVHTVTADITGAIYYWNLSQGQMERIDAMGRAPAIANPPANPTDAGNHCVACHTVSRDGRYLSGELWGGGLQSAVFDMSNTTVTMGPDPAPTLAPVTDSSYRALFSTFSPDATRLLVNNGTALSLVDPFSGASVASGGEPLPAANAAHPSWSPDGTAIAFVGNITSGGGPASWAVDYDVGDLQLLPVTGADQFGAAVTLAAAASEGPAFSAASWPSWSPDSGWIAYAAGSNSRGRNGATTYPGALFLVAKSGGAAVRLDTACGGALDCYLPNFSPYDSGGYYWLVFYSLRDYGNALAGTKGTGRRQMWIAAIDKAKLAAGQDPSVIPYWLPDQDSTTENMSAFWAVPPPLQ